VIHRTDGQINERDAGHNRPEAPKSVIPLHPKIETQNQKSASYYETSHTINEIAEPDTVLDWFTAALFAVGAIQAWILGLTLRRNRLTERPWVFAEPEAIEGLAFGINQFPITVNFRWKIRNHGRSPAWIVRTGIKFIVADVAALPAEPDYKGAEILAQAPIAPDQSFPQKTPKIIGPVDYEALMTALTKRLVLYGFIEYRDRFRRRSNESRFCMVYEPAIIRLPGYPDGWWTYGGPSAYNRNT
jgi:hypothetical protein